MLRAWAATAAILGTGLLLPGTALGAERWFPEPAQTVQDGPDPGPVDVRRTALAQDGPQITWTVDTRRGWDDAALRGGAGRRICLSVSRSGHEVHRACVVRRDGALAVRATDVGTDGNPVRWRAVDAEVRRPDRRTLEVTGDPLPLVGRRTGALRWTTTTAWEGGTACPAAAPCSDRSPSGRSSSYRLLPAVAAGCIASGPTLVTRGPVGRHQVALTFDDGPWTHTSRFLDELRRLKVHATFFMIGQQVGANAALLRRMVRDGHALGNHTWSHATVAGGGGGQITSTNDAVRRAVGYAPCLFRPPGGARGAALDAELSGLGMLDVLWTVDTNDWQLPGTAAVIRRASAAPDGGIVLMHDGGGPRDATLAALPAIVAHLRARGLEPVTVPELLGLRTRWRYG